ncbi:RagB/SusD family nutrient uptake outer membrane protein [Cellulophaga sp. E16_2]|uniref:RagB/SusD family nutrient uptake outer membrane protein n=1 Tax=Cellulophaga sp. E16_2 TaxID=2789297 RepID=UPI001A934713|nr:RagB/SusD family nutrient uptake outer membrane protein [Cellulophaga sp. E16_2]MBO0590228.1 RagB/SusD family nutrient uptake outer membrane protein [Cellulophaga sp. E16_2]
MKNINLSLKKISLPILFLGFLVTSCEKYLDQDPQDSVTEAVYFDTPEQFENAANYLYTRFTFDNGDEASDLSGNYTTPDYGQGLMAPTDADHTNITDDVWDDNYGRLRAPNQLIEKAVDFLGDQSEISTSIGTAYFFRAWHHFILLKRFGGVPIVTNSLDVTSEEVYAPRNSRYEVIYQILTDLDEAIAKLPTANNVEQGKLTTEAAMAYKARILLYEATWDKYVGETTDGDGVTAGAGSARPTGYPSVEEMLTEAKQLALNVINNGNFELWDQRATACGDDHLFYLYNLEEGSNPAGLTKVDNKEFIIQAVYDFSLRNLNRNNSHAKPVTPSRKMMDMYLCTDGLPVQYSSVFEGYDEMTSEFQNRDLRLKSFVYEPLKEYWGRGLSIDGGGAQYGTDFADAGTGFDYRYVPQLQSISGGRNIGYQGRKFVSEQIDRDGNSASPNWPVLRLAEVMLIYAEATVELGGGNISDTDLNISINKIRARAGVAPLTNALIAPYSDLTMLGEIRRERAIELDGENFRFNDLMRWGIAEEELNKNVCLTYITGTEYETAENPKSLGNTIYNASGFPLGLTSGEQSTSSYAGIATTKAGALLLDVSGNRNWNISRYLYSIPNNEIELNTNLLQNPGW